MIAITIKSINSMPAEREHYGITEFLIKRNQILSIPFNSSRIGLKSLTSPIDNKTTPCHDSKYQTGIIACKKYSFDKIVFPKKKVKKHTNFRITMNGNFNKKRCENLQFNTIYGKKK